MLDKYLIEYCSPTLASLKSANLFNYTYTCNSGLKKQLDLWNKQLRHKGVSIITLKKSSNKALLYVYRKSHLQRDLKKDGVAKVLQSYGYTSTDADYALSRLKLRLSEDDDFPHEIGLFLNYPLKDVVGFIENSGRNHKCVGCWKVYCDECEAVKTFEKFKKCKDKYACLWRSGKSVLQLTVPA